MIELSTHEIAEVTGGATAVDAVVRGIAIDSRAVTSYQPYWAVRAHLLKGMNRYGEAVEAFDRALGLADDAAVRRQLLDRLTEISRF